MDKKNRNSKFARIIFKKNPLQKLFIISLTLTIFLNIFQFANAQELISPTYKMMDPTISNSNSLGSSSTYSNYISIGAYASDPQLFSPTYQLNGDELNDFIANIPNIACLENNTSGSSDCTSGSAFLSGGLIRVCSAPGCYDRGRIEISAEGNPADTLYSIQISTDSNFATFQYISGTTNLPIAPGSRTMSDFKTKAAWESSDLNVLGLLPNTQYYFRITAMHGDLSESAPSPIGTLTTSEIAINFSLNLADEDENNPLVDQANLQFSVVPGLVSKSDSLFWLNSTSNVTSGISLYTNGLYGGLSDGTLVVIPSVNDDLNNLEIGFGLQYFESSQWYDPTDTAGNGAGTLGAIVVENNYIKNHDGATERVGMIPLGPTLQKVLSTTSPVYNGKAGLYIVAKTKLSTQVGQISETITLITTANY
jgi:hypothetical protein